MIGKPLLALCAGTIAMVATNGILAAGVIGPLFEHRYRDIVANPIRVPLLIAGYVIIALAMVILYPMLRLINGWIGRSLVAGASVGIAAFLGVHTVIAGYTTIDATSFVLSGLFDSLGALVGMMAIAYVYQRP